MKVRNGFVSNSSSSSFVVYGRDSAKLIKEMPTNLYTRVWEIWADRDIPIMTLPFADAELEFGWQFEQYHNIKDRFNFVVAMLISMKEEERYEYKEMLQKVLRKHMSHNEYLQIRYDYNYFFWDSTTNDLLSIDHQSAWGEGSNRELFENEKNLEDFIFNEDSFIQCGNDNEDKTPEWLEASILREKSIHKEVKIGEKFSFNRSFYYGKGMPKNGFSSKAYIILEEHPDRKPEYLLAVYDKNEKYEVYWGSKYDCEKYLQSYFKDCKLIEE